MLFLNATTPKETVQAVLHFLQGQVDRYEREASNCKLVRDRNMCHARSYAIKNAMASLQDCNIMHEVK